MRDKMYSENPNSYLTKSIGKRFRVLYLFYNKGMSMSKIAKELGMTRTTVTRYIYSWEENRYGLTRKDLEWALRNFDQFVG